MALRIRGQEATIRLSIDGQPQRRGSWVKVQNFTLTPRDEITEDDFLGEATSDLDYRFDGYDFSFETHVVERSIFEFMADIAQRHRDGSAHPRITMVVILKFKESGERPISITMPGIYMRVNESGFSNRKEFVTHSVEGKAKIVQVADI